MPLCPAQRQVEAGSDIVLKVDSRRGAGLARLESQQVQTGHEAGQPPRWRSSWSRERYTGHPDFSLPCTHPVRGDSLTESSSQTN